MSIRRIVNPSILLAATIVSGSVPAKGPAIHQTVIRPDLYSQSMPGGRVGLPMKTPRNPTHLPSL